mgnify:CR=1 FL=1
MHGFAGAYHRSGPALLCAAIVVAMLPWIACAETFVWAAAAGGLASAKSNWRTNGLVPERLPGPSDSILFDGTGAGPVVWNGGQDTGDGTLTDTVGSWTQTSAFGGEVLFSNLTFSSFSTVFTNFTIQGVCALSNGVWTHVSHPQGAGWTRRYLLRVSVGGLLEIGPAAAIRADGKGWWSDWNTSRLDPDQVGALGGTSGWTFRNSPPRAWKTAGSVKAPVEPGRGGTWGGGNWVPGGGTVWITAGGTASVDGVISACGVNMNNSDGSGGTIYLTARWLCGTGTLDASAAANSWGGGGRIAVVVTEGTSFGSVSCRAYGGPTTWGPGGPGTVYLEHAGHGSGNGILVIDNNNRLHSSFDGANIPPYFGYGACLMPMAGYGGPVNLDDFSEIIVTNRGILGIAADTTVNLGSPKIKVYGRDASFIAIRGTNNITFPSNWTISGFTLLLDTNVEAAGNWTVASDGRISQSVSKHWTTAGTNTGYPYMPPLTLILDGNLTVESGGEITVDGAGYVSSCGLGAGVNHDRAGSHGGQGGDNDGLPEYAYTYGSILRPVTPGSGGYWEGQNDSPGGGRMRLTVTGRTRVDGLISARAPARSRPGGAGGSLWLTTGTLEGTGAIDAGCAMDVSPGGGGGRVAVYLTDSDPFGSVAISARGGNPASGYDGAAGTVYLQRKSDGEGGGEIVVNNAGRTPSTNMVTHLPPAFGPCTDDLSNARVRLESNAVVALTSDCTIRDISIDSTSLLWLRGHTLRVRSAKHPLAGMVWEDGGKIVWTMSGTVVMVR